MVDRIALLAGGLGLGYWSIGGLATQLQTDLKVSFVGCPVQGLRDSFHYQYLPEPQALFVKGAGTRSDLREWSAMAKQPMESLS